MGIYKRLALASVLLSLLLLYVLKPDSKHHSEEAIANGALYLENQAEEAGLIGSLVSWGSNQLAEMTIQVKNYQSYAVFSTAEVYVGGIKRGDSFGCASKVWVLWEPLESETAED